MTDQPSLLARIARWLGLDRKNNGLPVQPPTTDANDANGQIQRRDQAPARPSFWRPWARRDAALASLQQGFNALTDLMAGIRENLDSQSRRQDEMLGYLATLPELLGTMSNGQNLQTESLRAITQLVQQSGQQQSRLTEILDRVGEAQTAQRQSLETLAGRMEGISEHNAAITGNLRQVGSAMEAMGRSTEQSAVVLRRLNDDLAARNEQLERVIRRQNQRLTVLLMVAMGLSAASIIAVSVFGFLALRH